MTDHLFNHTGYVPILRRRSAEIAALTNLLNEDFGQITPLFEMCEHILSDERRKAIRETDINIYLYDVIKSLASCCGAKPYFIDFENVEDVFSDERGRHPIAIFFELLRFHFLSAIPVTGINRSEAYQQAISAILRQNKTGVCIRLSQSDVRETTLVPRLQLFLRRFGLAPKQVDLLVDLKKIRQSSPSIEEICNRLPMLNEWRTFTVAGGAFPENLAEFEKNGEYEVERNDWMHWARGVDNRQQLQRIPTYSDYTVQYPGSLKALDFVPNVSASIRYSSLKHWVIMRGEGLRNENGAKFEQYWGQANSLMYRDEYSGEDFSFGDQYVARIGSQSIQTGNPATWLRAAINRHMTLTARQISQLFVDGTVRESEIGRRMRRPPLKRFWNQSRLVLPASPDQGYLFQPGE